MKKKKEKYRLSIPPIAIFLHIFHKVSSQVGFLRLYPFLNAGPFKIHIYNDY